MTNRDRRDITHHRNKLQRKRENNTKGNTYGGEGNTR
jgi:hypothetical protein